ncbi:hypothetical protein BDK51DRAFT_31299 [Blyttiomyces helicus]|uniref:Uncharacterized protein n=1 Tax=Blyttiomyces helicus TaxID=388810 RepID=A0A4P9WPG1_9FUNG|nr:hypothetical protein BDK51DRAFT_31299 [Blyttiomyces helicus]|eukprot:RKO93130.1 hypothetical protein BDK51DRAFT_31299 [Blyttiomyces helicus]
MDKMVDNAASVPCKTVIFFFFKMRERKSSTPSQQFTAKLEDSSIGCNVFSAHKMTSMYIWQDDGQLDSDLWSIHNLATPYPLPPGLSDSISIIAACNSMQFESARQDIISLYLSYALHTVDPDVKFFTIAEEININIIKKVKYDSISETLQYKGPIDFLVSYSVNARSKAKHILSDAALLDVKANHQTTFEAALGQVIPQAASILCHPRNAVRSSGAYQPHWACSDGQRWVFGCVRPEGAGTLVWVHMTDELKGHLKPALDNKGRELVFNHVVGWVSREFLSMPWNSLVDLPEMGDYSDEEADGLEDDPDTGLSLTNSVVDPLSSVRL